MTRLFYLAAHCLGAFLGASVLLHAFGAPSSLADRVGLALTLTAAMGVGMLVEVAERRVKR